MEVRHTFPECCITCEHRLVLNNQSSCELDEEIELKTKIIQVLTVCSNYDPSWDVQNAYRNKLGLPSLPLNYYPYGSMGRYARQKLTDAFEAQKEPLGLQEQLEIFIGSQRS